MIETRGERLLLTRSNFFVPGRPDRADFGDLQWSLLLVDEVDERGRRCAMWLFDIDDLDRARATLDERDEVLRRSDG